ncbi:MAG: DegV family protein [Erysipelotrichaceae bacterium]
MNKEKIAILTDSGCDVPQKYIDLYDMYVLPLEIHFQDKHYQDGVDITPNEVYERLSTEIPKTSLPTGESVLTMFKKIKADGYDKVIVITLSSGLSGTNNMISLIAKDYHELEFTIIDTKNISVGGGFSAIYAGKLIEEGKSYQEVCDIISNGVQRSKVFFVVETLEYLQKGGRIGLVASLFGNALDLKPIISCNDEGIYYTVAKVRGRKHSISKTIELAKKYAGEHENYIMAIMNGAASDLAKEIEKEMLPYVEKSSIFVENQISPALGVHTGPGLIGIGFYLLDK